MSTVIGEKKTTKEISDELSLLKTWQNSKQGRGRTGATGHARAREPAPCRSSGSLGVPVSPAAGARGNLSSPGSSRTGSPPLALLGPQPRPVLLPDSLHPRSVLHPGGLQPRTAGQERMARPGLDLQISFGFLEV